MRRTDGALNGRVILAAFFIVAGIMHFVMPGAYVRIVPPAIPLPRLLVLVSGIAEVLGGIGLLVPLTRRAAAWSLAILLVAVFPANIYAAIAHLPLPGILGQRWAEWLRLPLQVPLIWWTLSCAGRATTRPDRNTVDRSCDECKDVGPRAL